MSNFLLWLIAQNTAQSLAHQMQKDDPVGWLVANTTFFLDRNNSCNSCTSLFCPSRSILDHRFICRSRNSAHFCSSSHGPKKEKKWRNRRWSFHRLVYSFPCRGAGLRACYFSHDRSINEAARGRLHFFSSEFSARIRTYAAPATILLTDMKISLQNNLLFLQSGCIVNTNREVPHESH